VILFDGVCVLCSSWVQFVIRRDPDCRFHFLQIQSPQGRQLAESLGIDPDAPETNAVIFDGTAYFKSDAALMVLQHLRGMEWTRALKLIPKGPRDWLYDRIARNRYAWFGRDEACLRPIPEVSTRLTRPSAHCPGGSLSDSAPSISSLRSPSTHPVSRSRSSAGGSGL
jgi:predicted DCC family thiol-disulfide oxidoreductase YuxK